MEGSGTWLEGGNDAAKLTKSSHDVAIDGQTFQGGDLDAQLIQSCRRPWPDAQNFFHAGRFRTFIVAHEFFKRASRQGEDR